MPIYHARYIIYLSLVCLPLLQARDFVLFTVVTPGARTGRLLIDTEEWRDAQKFQKKGRPDREAQAGLNKTTGSAVILCDFTSLRLSFLAW